jgi:hypothetical protein
VAAAKQEKEQVEDSLNSLMCDLKGQLSHANSTTEAAALAGLSIQELMQSLQVGAVGTLSHQHLST